MIEGGLEIVLIHIKKVVDYIILNAWPNPRVPHRADFWVKT